MHFAPLKGNFDRLTWSMTEGFPLKRTLSRKPSILLGQSQPLPRWEIHKMEIVVSAPLGFQEKDLLDGLVDFIFPRDCILTGEPLEAGPWQHLSTRGVAQLERITDPRCATCGHPFWGVLVGPRNCPHCINLSPAFGRALCAFRSKGAMRHLIHRMKYRNEPFLARDLVLFALEDVSVQRHLAGSFLIPVPLYQSRQHARGYNQARILAKEFSLHVAGCAFLDVLERTRDTGQQVKFNREQRVQNMDDAFRISKKSKLPAGRYVVVDDVLTTGATLSACAVALRIGGASHIDAVALAHG
jgi:ComF family protein